MEDVVAAKGIKITADDLETGDHGESVILPGQYILIPAEPLYLDGKVVHQNGTVVLTLKRRK